MSTGEDMEGIEIPDRSIDEGLPINEISGEFTVSKILKCISVSN